jgi:hypothetical protein
MILGIVVALATNSMEWSLCASIIGSIFGGLIAHHVQPTRKTLPEEFISRLLISYGKLVDLYTQNVLN